MTKLGALRVDFVGDSKSLDVAAAKAKNSLASVGKQVERTSQKQVMASKTAGKFGTSMAGMGQKVGLAKGGLRNMTFQLQDIIVQMNMGTRMSTIMAQQLPQLGASFGAVGLIVFSVVGALAAVAPLFLGVSEKSQTLSESMDDLTESTSDYLSALKSTAQDLDNIRAKFGTMTQSAQAAFVIMAQLKKLDALSSLSKTITKISEKVSNFSDVMDLIAIKMPKAYEATTEAGKKTLRSIDELQEAFEEVGRATGPRDQAVALGNLIDLFIKLRGGVKNLNDEQRSFIQQMIVAQQNARILTDDVKGLATETARASEFMDDYATKTGAMAKNVGDAARASADRLTEENRISAVLKDEDLAMSGLLVISKELQLSAKKTADHRERSAMAMLRVRFGQDEDLAMSQTFKIDPRNIPSDDPKKPRKISPLERDLESLEKNLSTEIELEMDHFATQAQVLQEALDGQMLSQDQFQELSERSKKQHLDKMEQLDRMSKTNQLGMAQGIFSDLSTLMNTRSKKLFAIGKAAAIAESIISTHRGITKALELPFPTNLAAAAAVGAKGFASVAAIQAQSIGGGGGGGTAAVTTAPAAADQAQGGGANTLVNVSLRGDNFSASGVRGLLDSINDVLEDGGRVRIV